MKIKGDGWTADPPVDVLGLPLPGMTQQEKLRLRRLVTDLEPFTEALQRLAEEGRDSTNPLRESSAMARYWLVRFKETAEATLQR